MTQEQQINTIEPVLSELKGDIRVPKNVRMKVERVLKILREKSEMPIKASKALNELEEIAEDVNLEPYTRTQIWGIISILAKVSK
ncbi:MAG: UPF0147 family protein [Nanoarchaeota archaeon]